MSLLSAELEPGFELAGKYRIEALLGRGAMGTVYAGTHLVTGRKVAIKFLNPELSGNEEVTRRFLQEAKAAASLDHPNVVDVLDMDTDAHGNTYLVLEHLTGESFEDYLQRQGKLTPAEALSLLLPIMGALEFAHQRKIIHRDIKPENIFLSRDETGQIVPKLLDFGIAKVLEAKDGTATRTGITVGTPAYMSPEQIMAYQDVGPPADVWSMGVVLFQALSGQLPYDAEGVMQLAMTIAHTDAPSLVTCARHLPPGLIEVIDTALKRQRAKRYATMADFMTALKDACARAGIELMGSSTGLRYSIFARSRDGSVAGAATAATASGARDGLLGGISQVGGRPRSETFEENTHTLIRSSKAPPPQMSTSGVARLLARRKLVTLIGLQLLVIGVLIAFVTSRDKLREGAGQARAHQSGTQQATMVPAPNGAPKSNAANGPTAPVAVTPAPAQPDAQQHQAADADDSEVSGPDQKADGERASRRTRSSDERKPARRIAKPTKSSKHSAKRTRSIRSTSRKAHHAKPTKSARRKPQRRSRR